MNIGQQLFIVIFKEGLVSFLRNSGNLYKNQMPIYFFHIDKSMNLNQLLPLSKLKLCFLNANENK